MPDPQLPETSSIRDAARKAVGAHAAVIEGVTPEHPNWCADDEEAYTARFSAWHSAMRELRKVLNVGEAPDA